MKIKQIEEMVIMNRIEICGNIASGKTTFATLSQAYGYNAILEDFKKIPYLEDFYFSPSEFAFETEISFTLQHYYQIKKASSNTFITDFSLINDCNIIRIFYFTTHYFFQC